jgi:hypothetical protein
VTLIFHLRPGRPSRLAAALSVFLLMFAMVIPDPTAAQTVPPDPQTYTGWVREALAAARRGDRIGLEESGGRLADVTHVQLADGTSIPVDNSWLRAELDHEPPDSALIAERLGSLADALAQPPGAAPEDALERLRAILSRPPYARPEPSPPPQWLIDLGNWLGRMIEALLRPLAPALPGTVNSVAWIIAGIGIILLLGVIIYLINGLRRGVVSEAPKANDDPEANLTAREAIDQAGSLARDGDYRTAVRFLYLAALLRLDERGLLHYDRALTNREYIERVRDNPALRETLTGIVETFDRVWYGHMSIDQAAFERYRTSVERVGREA